MQDLLELELKPKKKWLEQLGIVKKLQVALVISWILIILLSMQLIKTNTQSETKAKAAPVEAKLDMNQARTFARAYLENFFNASDDKSLAYLQAHSEEQLFVKNLYPELMTRRKEKILSELSIDQLYLEELTNTSAKAICFAREEFPHGNYQSRELTIEMLIDLSGAEPKVSSIPVFKVME